MRSDRATATTPKTGTAADTTAPKLDAVGNAAARGNVRAGGGDCSIHGPWIEVGPVRVDVARGLTGEEAGWTVSLNIGADL